MNLESLINMIREDLWNHAPAIAKGLGLLIISWILGIVLRSIINRTGARTKLDVDVVDLIAKVIFITILIFGFVTAMGTIGVDVSALVAGLGLTGFALGFALKDLLSNLLAGVLILVYRPFVRGDRIEINKYTGTVVDIDLRYTTIEHDEDRIFVPNSTLFTSPIRLVGVLKSREDS